MLSKFSGVESERTVSKVKKKLSFCVMFTYAIKRAREIGKFNVAVVQRMLRKKRYARAKLLFCCYKKPFAFLPFSLPSPSLLSSVLL